jgi:GNAT superfamily N-acetyltransferase
VAATEISFDILNGRQAADHVADLEALHAEVYDAEPLRRDDDARAFARRFTVQCRQPGFVLARARHGEYLVGYAHGMPLRLATSWWRHLTTPLPEEMTTEHPGRTFAVTDLLVRAAWRRQGIGTALHDLVLAGRSEERATLTAVPDARPAQHALRSWGWRKVARTRDPGPDSALLDVLLITLPAGPRGSCQTSPGE